MNNTSIAAVEGSAPWNSPYSVAVQVLVWIVVAILSLETIIGNAMVIIAYKIERNISKQVSNRYIVSLAISDLIIGIEGFPLFTVYVLNNEKWPLGSMTCETWLFLDYTLCLVSILTVLLITADRYLSVCHTAKYLKWQSPTKTQITIILSWLFPAIIFGIMIFGWSAMTGSSESMSGEQCSAPFLTNPYVNMGMYVAYYWTTLVAMLILYKGIHQAAKNLEKKAKAKERRHIALILSQRLGTQVGVSLMLQSRNEREKREQQEEEERLRREAAAEVDTRRDSGYHTAVAVSTILAESEQNLTIIQEEKSAIEHSSRRESALEVPNQPEVAIHEVQKPVIDEVLNDEQSSHFHRSASEEKVEQNEVKENEDIRDDRESENDHAQLDKADSLSLLFNEEDLSSVLRFKTSLHQKDSNADSTNSSIIARPHRKFNKNSRSRISGRNSSKNGGVTTKIARRQASEKELHRPVPVVAVEEVGEEVPERKTSDRWVKSMKARISRAMVRTRPTVLVRQRERERSSSSDSSMSSMAMDKETVKEVEVHKAPPKPSPSAGLAPPRPASSETLLSPTGMTRKISSLSSAFTRERMITTIFGPIMNRGRKPTKAEKRAHKAFRTITFIVGFFAILWSPYYVMATVYGFCKGTCIPSLLYTLSYYMCYLNSSGNPFAYALANRQFRMAFLRMLRGNFNTVV